MKIKNNLWVILAVLIIGIPAGYVVMGIIRHDTPTPDPNPPVDTLYLSIQPTSITFEVEEDSRPVTIQSNTEWSANIEGGDGWLTLNPDSGNNNKTITLRATKNESTSSRTASVDFSWKDNQGSIQKNTLSISQKGSAPSPVSYLSVKPTSITLKAEGDSKTVTVQSNTEWSANIEGGDGWLTLSPNSGNNNKTITLRATKNESTSSRTASVDFSWKDDQGSFQKNTIKISQEGSAPSPVSYLSVKPTSITLKAEGDSKTVTVQSNTEWVAKIEGGDGWLTLSANSGKNNKAITLSATKNESTSNRTAHVDFSWKDDQGSIQKNTINISQEGSTPPPPSHLTVNPTNLNFKAEGDSKTISIQSNTEWKVLIKDGNNWLTVNNNSGNGNKKITIKALKNTSNDSRSATLEFYWKDYQGVEKNSIVSVFQSENLIPIPKPLTIEEAQSILSSGKKNSKIPETCTIIVNGTSKQYKKFREPIDMGMGYYGNDLRVTDIKCDSKGIATMITVTVSINEGDTED